MGHAGFMRQAQTLHALEDYPAGLSKRHPAAHDSICLGLASAG